jgi:ribosomal protein L37AE/L43A
MLIITHPNKPGAGHVVQFKSEGGVGFESDIQTCSHCQAVVEVHRKDVSYGYCRKCDHVLCATCGKKAVTEGCSPFKAAIDRFQEEQYRLSQYPIAV